MRGVVLGLALAVGVSACELVPGCGAKAPKLQADRVTVEQGVWGQVNFWQGNFMPGGCTSGTITAVRRQLFVYPPTPDSVVVHDGYGGFIKSIPIPAVDSVWSDDSGFFQIALPAGDYSLLVREEGRLFANLWGQDFIIRPVRVEVGAATALTFNIDYKAAW